MSMPGRSFRGGSSIYRYGFNGKEDDKDISEGGQDYGMRIYDKRICKFLSLDPLQKKYPYLTPYQFASNRPIDGIDLDGAEYMPTIPTFQYSGNRSLTDYASAVDNGVINVINIVPTVWNSAVSNVKSLMNGTWGQDMKKELGATGDGMKKTAIQFYHAPLTTLTSPEAVEFGVSTYVGAKIFSVGAKAGNLLKVENQASVAGRTALQTEAVGAEESNAALAAKYAKNRPTFRQGTVNKVWDAAKDVNGKVYDPNTFEELSWDKDNSRYNQWHMGHKPGFEYNKLVEQLKIGKINKQQFLDEYNNPNNYQPEAPASNKSNKYEAKTPPPATTDGH